VRIPDGHQFNGPQPNKATYGYRIGAVELISRQDAERDKVLGDKCEKQIRGNPERATNFMKKPIPEVGTKIQYRLANFMPYEDGVVVVSRPEDRNFDVKNERNRWSTVLTDEDDFIVISGP
jgi:hypothetical protein